MALVPVAPCRSGPWPGDPSRVGLLAQRQGLRDARRPPHRAEHYGRAAGARPAGTYARIVALDLVAGAEMQLKRGQIEQACTTWNRALDHMDGVRCAAELDERAIDFLASA
ncbi:hypothetical protein Srufu_013530 [Streptomyces libani subsp. rufus]|nr:hypothetical protein Srufu_013530 [Streptomyces libani subsp. rufus]